jgi:tetratricopeptide (TPR) repeat protein
VLQVLRRFLLDRTDVASREAIETISAKSGARFVLVPTLLYHGGLWSARIEIRVPRTGLNVQTYETAGVSSSMATEVAFGFMSDLAAHVNEYLASPRTRWRQWLRLSDGGSTERVVRSLAAAGHFEEGLDAYDRLEYASDRRSPLMMAWLARVEMLMRQDDAAAESAARARALIDAQTPRGAAWFTEAIAAEARAEYDTAEARYGALVRRYADEPAWLIELAAFQERRTRNADAIATYHRALALDPLLTRAHLELCRLYSPSRTNEPARAKTEGEQALTSYRALGDQPGEVQALFCLIDVLRVGGPAERKEALAHAYRASTIVDAIKQEYNLPRADNYIALIVGSDGDIPTAVKHWEKALVNAQASGNRVLAPRVMNNLGVSHQALGDLARAVEMYRQSYELNEKLGDQQEAARTRANAGAILIEYGNIDEGLRDVQSAQRVAEKLTDKAFEVLCLQLVAAYHRQIGHYTEANRILSQALNIATERGLASRVISSTVDLARLHLEMGRYESARELLAKALMDKSGRESARARAILGLLFVRLGRFDEADAEFAAVQQELHRRGDLLPFIQLSIGELAYERGQIASARDALRRAAAVPASGDLRDTATLEAGAMLDVLSPGIAAPGLDRCLRDAQRQGRVTLLARCRLHRARTLVEQGRSEAALQTLAEIPSTGFDPGPEMLAQVHHWRAEALTQSGKPSAAAIEAARARSLIDTIRQALRPDDREAFSARRDVRRYFLN